MEKKSYQLDFQKIRRKTQIKDAYSFNIYLKNIFSDLSNRESSDKKKKGIEKITFIEYMNLPFVVGEKLFNVLDINKNGKLENDEFIKGITNLYLGRLEDTQKIIFDMLDFDSDGIIIPEDSRLLIIFIKNLLNQQNQQTDIIKLKSNSNKVLTDEENIEEINNLINNFFNGKKKMNFVEYKNSIENINSDVFFLFIYFLYNNKPFKENSIRIIRLMGNSSHVFSSMNSSMCSDMDNEENKSVKGKSKIRRPSKILSSFMSDIISNLDINEIENECVDYNSDEESDNDYNEDIFLNTEEYEISYDHSKMNIPYLLPKSLNELKNDNDFIKKNSFNKKYLGTKITDKSFYNFIKKNTKKNQNTDNHENKNIYYYDYYNSNENANFDKTNQVGKNSGPLNKLLEKKIEENSQEISDADKFLKNLKKGIEKSRKYNYNDKINLDCKKLETLKDEKNSYFNIKLNVECDTKRNKNSTFQVNSMIKNLSNFSLNEKIINNEIEINLNEIKSHGSIKYKNIKESFFIKNDDVSINNQTNPIFDSGRKLFCNISDSVNSLSNNLMFDEKIVNDIIYENYIFKSKNNNKLKKYYIVLIGMDLFYFSNHNKKKLRGMHNLSGSYILEGDSIIKVHQENRQSKFKSNLSGNNSNLNSSTKGKIETVLYYPFKLIFKKKPRNYYCSDEKEAKLWIKHIRSVTKFREIKDYYKLGKDLGSGKFGMVKKGANKLTEKVYAIKSIKKNLLNTKEYEMVKTEIEIMKFCRHKNIVNFYDSFEDIEYIHLILEYLSGGNLSSYLYKQTVLLSEERIKELIFQIGSVINYLHYFGIIHRDLKPENTMMTDIGNTAQIKIIDFGLSKILGVNENSKEAYGTLSFAAPEVLSKIDYNKKIDIWSIGIILYFLICGYLPFNDNDNDFSKIADSIKSGNIKYDKKIWMKISPQCLELVQKCLERNVNKRLDINEFLKHPWFSKNKKYLII
jgi:tRNA A-37 threonylcarbamoyl transferase component Bud32